MKSTCALVLCVGVLVGCAEGERRRPRDLDDDSAVADAGGSSESDAGSGAEDAQDPVPFERCLVRSFASTPVPLELQLLIDQSVSMAGDRWDAVQRATLSFADTARILALSLSVQVFPHFSRDEECRVGAYAYPIVPMQPTPDVAVQLKSFYDRYGPTGLISPARPALSGTLDYLAARAARDPLAQRAAVLITDGLSNSCDSTLENVALAAAESLRADSPIPTFVIGMEGAALEALDAIAEAGGTEHAYVIGDDTRGAEALETVLNAARAWATACDFEVPDSDEGRVDTALVEVSVDDGSGADPERLPLFDRKERCAGGSEGFYYDDNQNPARITLCDTSCTRVRALARPDAVRVEAACVIVLR